MWEIKMTTFQVEVAQKKDNESVNSADNSTRKDVLVSSKRPSVPWNKCQQKKRYLLVKWW